MNRMNPYINMDCAKDCIPVEGRHTIVEVSVGSVPFLCLEHLLHRITAFCQPDGCLIM